MTVEELFKAGAASRDAEVAELKNQLADNNLFDSDRNQWRNTYRRTISDLTKERDQLREQVTLLRDALDIAYDHLLVHWTKEELLTVVPLNKIAEALAATDDHHE